MGSIYIWIRGSNLNAGLVGTLFRSSKDKDWFEAIGWRPTEDNHLECGTAELVILEEYNGS